MTKCEQIIVNAAIAAGRISERRGRSVAMQVEQCLRSMRKRNKFVATPRYCVEMLNCTNYSNSLAHAKRWALANRSYVRGDMMGWSDENLKVKDSKTGIAIWECSAWN